MLRGLHFSVEPGQAKLVRCARGSIRDVVVDLRVGSPTFGQWQANDLDDVRHHQLYVPVGFAHGFVVTSDVADVVYKCSAYYDGASRAVAGVGRSRGRRRLGRGGSARERPRPDGAAAGGDQGVVPFRG